MVIKVHFNEKIETVETYDAVDYDRTSVPIAELNDDEYNEIECYRLEMKKQTIEEYQKRWKKSRNSNSSDSPVSDLSHNSSSESENISPTLKSCLVRKDSNNASNKLNVSAINAAMTVAMSSSLEDDTSYFRKGQAQPNILLNTPHSSDYNSDECPKVDLEFNSSIDSNNEIISNPNCLHLFSKSEQDIIEEKEDGLKHQSSHNIISPLSFSSVDTPVSDNDADVEESEGDNSFIRLNESSFEDKNVEEDSDYIKDMSLTEGENSISLNHHILSDDIPTTSFHSTNHRLFTDSLFTSSPILPVAVVETKAPKSSHLQDEIESSTHEESKEIDEINISLSKQHLDDESIDEEVKETITKDDTNSINNNVEEEEEEEEDNVIDSHPHSDTFINYGGSQHINIKPRRQYINNLYDGMSSSPMGKPMSFLDDLPETFQTPLSSSLPSKNYSPRLTASSTNFFGSPFSPPPKSPYGNSPSSPYLRASRLNTSSNYTTGSSNSNEGNYLVSKRNYLSISGNREPKSKSYSSYSQNRLSHYTTSKWEGIGSRTKSNSTGNLSNNSSSSPNKYYPRSATKLVSNSPFSSSWIYDASF